jgi:hypothetical protein
VRVLQAAAGCLLMLHTAGVLAQADGAHRLHAVFLGARAPFNRTCVCTIGLAVTTTGHVGACRMAS